jgi:hypothetical protein
MGISDRFRIAERVRVWSKNRSRFKVCGSDSEVSFYLESGYEITAIELFYKCRHFITRSMK